MLILYRCFFTLRKPGNFCEKMKNSSKDLQKSIKYSKLGYKRVEITMYGVI